MRLWVMAKRFSKRQNYIKVLVSVKARDYAYRTISLRYYQKKRGIPLKLRVVTISRSDISLSGTVVSSSGSKSSDESYDNV